jgi:hypothetical protein
VFAVPNISALVGAQRILTRYSGIYRHGGDSEPFSFLSAALGALDFKMVSSFCSRCQDSVHCALLAKVVQITCITGARMLAPNSSVGLDSLPGCSLLRGALIQKDSGGA